MADILIIEDDQTLSSAYKLILEHAGYSVNVADNGQAGLSLASQDTPKIILLDLLMPVLDGIGFLREFKPTDKKEPKVVILSNMGDEKLVEEARSLGAHKYIVKAHTSPNQLTKLVNTIIAK